MYLHQAELFCNLLGVELNEEWTVESVKGFLEIHRIKNYKTDENSNTLFKWEMYDSFDDKWKNINNDEINSTILESEIQEIK